MLSVDVYLVAGPGVHQAEARLPAHETSTPISDAQVEPEAPRVYRIRPHRHLLCRAVDRRKWLAPIILILELALDRHKARHADHLPHDVTGPSRHEDKRIDPTVA